MGEVIQIKTKKIIYNDDTDIVKKYNYMLSITKEMAKINKYLCDEIDKVRLQLGTKTKLLEASELLRKRDYEYNARKYGKTVIPLKV